MTLGQKLTNLRKARGMTQEELSEAVGVTRQTISKWELDTSTPDLDYLCKLCDLFGVTADDLIRPEREAAEASPSLQMEQTVSVPQGAPTPPPPASSSSVKTVSGVRAVGWVLFILGIVLIQVAILFVLFRISSTVLWILAGICIVIGLELFLVRWKPLFIVMWTVWLLWSFIQFVLFFGFFAVFAFIPAFILFALWIFYTAFCIGATVGVICKHIRTKRAQR
jgi:transcriptional regulator with XRE-family HTH domain